METKALACRKRSDWRRRQIRLLLRVTVPSGEKGSTSCGIYKLCAVTGEENVRERRGKAGAPFFVGIVVMCHRRRNNLIVFHYALVLVANVIVML